MQNKKVVNEPVNNKGNANGNVIINENKEKRGMGRKTVKTGTESPFSVGENNLPVAKIRITFAPSLTYYTK